MPSNFLQLITLSRLLTWSLTLILLVEVKDLLSSTNGSKPISKTASYRERKCVWTRTSVYFLQDLFSSYICMRMTYSLRFFCSWLLCLLVWSIS
ncbi:unnamed protein product [Linum tenue]|uniref:Secreted protein n=1 Tax=Linum tenue TaxID=586396 RepID=A0AAV0L6I6_9ROSI|nr:unnamed protein product [Linum tenue]